MRYFKTLKNFFKKNKDNEEEVDGIESDEMYVSDASATIEIRLDSNTGDFNIVVGVDEISNECARNLALILYMLNSGNLSEYFTDAYENWCQNDTKKQLFVEDLLLNWIINKDTYSENKEKLAIRPADVFKFSDYVK